MSWGGYLFKTFAAVSGPGSGIAWSSKTLVAHRLHIMLAAILSCSEYAALASEF